MDLCGVQTGMSTRTAQASHATAGKVMESDTYVYRHWDSFDLIFNPLCGWKACPCTVLVCVCVGMLVWTCWHRASVWDHVCRVQANTHCILDPVCVCVCVCVCVGRCLYACSSGWTFRPQI